MAPAPCLFRFSKNPMYYLYCIINHVHLLYTKKDTKNMFYYYVIWLEFGTCDQYPSSLLVEILNMWSISIMLIGWNLEHVIIFHHAYWLKFGTCDHLPSCLLVEIWNMWSSSIMLIGWNLEHVIIFHHGCISSIGVIKIGSTCSKNI